MSKVYLFVDRFNKPKDRSQLASHHITRIGLLSPGLFGAAVNQTVKSVKKNPEKGFKLYAGTLKQGRPDFIAKLFLIHDNPEIFSTFYRPDGERLRKAAKLPKSLERSEKRYPSRPAIGNDYNTRILEIVV
jgi:hypothetical protein